MDLYAYLRGFPQTRLQIEGGKFPRNSTSEILVVSLSNFEFLKTQWTPHKGKLPRDDQALRLKHF